ncbi:MAG: mandelate racemase/muconate lactonizing enzyme family protein [Proteobacteria bacterium]|nr:mandelate racemase/muconate lactonizing enzyme family protein [Pseudomonadota bacterium]
MTRPSSGVGPIEAALTPRLKALNADLSLSPVSLRLHLFRAPVDPPMRTVFGTMVSRPALLITVRDRDGNSGTGEIWCNFPLVGAEHRRNLAAGLLPELVTGERFANPAAATDHLLCVLHTLGLQAGEDGPLNQIIAGLDVALWDLVARRAQKPLFRLFGGADTVPVYASSLPPDTPLRLAMPAAERGHVAFKLRIGFGADRDLANLATLRRALGMRPAIMVDANQTWSVHEAKAMMSAMTEFAPAWLEEPLPADRPAAEWGALRTAGSTPLAGGENLRALSAFTDAIDAGTLDVVQPDLGKWGGLSGTLVIADHALARQRRFCPHWLTGGVGFAASLHLQAILGGRDFVELDANPNPLRELVIDPEVRDGRVRLTEAWGHGASDAVDRLSRYEI